MESLVEIKRQIVADGRLSVTDVNLLSDKLYGGDGLTREKGDFLFKLKDMISDDLLIPEFKKLFVEYMTALLLEDEDSPGEIDESEAKWLRAKIQTKGYIDKVDRLLLKSLQNKSINFPEILNFKGTASRQFEFLLFSSRFLTIFAVFGALLSAVVLFVRGTVVVYHGLCDFIHSFSLTEHGDYEKLIEAFVSSVDIYLFAMVLIIFGMGIYELFINKIDPVDKKNRLSSIMVANFKY